MVQSKDLDYRVFFWHGDQDEAFEYKRTYQLYTTLFKKLGIENTIKVMEIETDLGHKTSRPGIEALMKFID